MFLEVSSCELIAPLSPQGSIVDLNCVGSCCFRSCLLQGGAIRLRGKPVSGRSNLSVADSLLAGGAPRHPLITAGVGVYGAWDVRLTNVSQNNGGGMSETVASEFTRYRPGQPPKVLSSLCEEEDGKTDLFCSSAGGFEMSTATAALYLGARDLAGPWPGRPREPNSPTPNQTLHTNARTTVQNISWAPDNTLGDPNRAHRLMALCARAGRD
jgi:hypothetical protein